MERTTGAATVKFRARRGQLQTPISQRQFAFQTAQSEAPQVQLAHLDGAARAQKFRPTRRREHCWRREDAIKEAFRAFCREPAGELADVQPVRRKIKLPRTRQSAG